MRIVLNENLILPNGFSEKIAKFVNKIMKNDKNLMKRNVMMCIMNGIVG